MIRSAEAAIIVIPIVANSTSGKNSPRHSSPEREK